MKISICLITYNHEAFITAAIESVLMQQTTAEIELVIGEDNSKDSTRVICEDFQQRFPDIVKLLPLERNKGMMRNFISTFKACTGNYIAFLEGDDYWTDPLKLQKQIDFLEKSPGYSCCFHNVIIKFQRTGEDAERIFHSNLDKDVFATEDLLKQWFIPSASLLIVNYPDFELPEWFVHCKSGDIPFLLLLSLRGSIKYLDEVMSVYRVHDNGISTTHQGYEKIIGMVYIYENFNIYTNHRFKQKIKEAIIYEIDYHLPKPKAEPMVIENKNKVQGLMSRIRNIRKLFQNKLSLVIKGGF